MKRYLFIGFIIMLVTLRGILFPSMEENVLAQGWQMYADELKQDAAKRRKERSNGIPTGTPNGNASVPARNFNPGQGEADPAAPTASPQADPAVSTEKPTNKDTVAPTENSKANPKTSTGKKGRRGILDFSEMLGETPQTWSSDELSIVSEHVRPEVARAPSLPGCHDFPEMKNDATCNDLFFLDAKKGVAVGDRGTIWMTIDGGTQWNLIASGTDASLYSVHFSDTLNGFIVGGQLLPTCGNGQGVILRTVDGGMNWTRIEHPGFPILRKVVCQNANQAWMAGDSSELYPGGIFSSNDGGKSWSPISGNRHIGWSDLLYDPSGKIGLGINTEGTLQRANGAVREEIPLSVGRKRIRAIRRLTANEPVRIAGDGGLIMESPDGRTWRNISANLPANSGDYFDFQTIWSAGSTIIVAGSPGSMIFTSHDGGQTWSGAATGVQVPIHRITFANPQQGWAVGELGTILVTEDGGKSWRIQRSGGRRVALLGMFGRDREIVPEPLVQICGEQGYLGKVVLMAREESREKTPAEIPWLLRWQECLVQTGSNGIVQTGAFIVDPDEWASPIDKIIARFDRENDSHGLDRFREMLVRQLRIWRPDVLIISDPALSPFAAFLDRELPRAIQSAKDPLLYPEHLNLCGLTPWTVRRGYRINKPRDSKEQATNTNTQPTVRILSSRFCAVLGRTIGEVSGPARACLDSERYRVPGEIECSVLFDTTGSAAVVTGSGDLLAGLQLDYGSDARRIRFRGLAGQREEYSHRATRRREILAIGNTLASRQGKNELSGEILLSQLEEMIRGLDPELAIEYLTTVGNKFAQQGNMVAAEEVFSMIALEFPRNEAAREALVWLVQFYAGREPHWRSEKNNRRSETTSVQAGQNIVNQTRTTRALDPAKTGNRLRNANELGKLIRGFHPQLYMSPEIRFPLATVQRQLGYTRDAGGYFLNRSLLSKYDLWGIRARAEYWLSAPNKESLPQGERLCPLQIFSCLATSVKPFLDGIPEPEIWESAKHVSFSEKPLAEMPRNPDRIDKNETDPLAWQKENRKNSQKFGTTMALLYDTEYLYLLIQCQKVPGKTYPKEEKEGPRNRNTDLSQSDRIEIQLDPDRDYSTAYKLVIDSRGWINESAWSDTSWNPAIFIARAETENSWSLEIALAMEDLSPRPPTRADVWGIAARRIVPGIGCETWNAENSIHGTNGFGFLTFGF